MDKRERERERERGEGNEGRKRDCKENSHTHLAARLNGETDYGAGHGREHTRANILLGLRGHKLRQSGENAASEEW